MAGRLTRTRARAARRLAPVRELTRHLHPVSALGWAVLVCAALLGTGAVMLGWVELAVPAVALAVAFAASVVATVGRSAYRIDLDLADRRVTVGERALGRIVVHSEGRRRMLPAQIELPVGAGAADFDLPSLAPGEEHEEIFAIPTSRRAVIVVGPVRSSRGDPVGLVRRRLRWTEPTELYVHPALVSLSQASPGVLRDLEGQATRVISESDMSFHALREYVPGDDRRYIHWKISARLGKYMVRQFEDTRRTHIALTLSSHLVDYAHDAEFELAVSTLASIGVQAIRDERDLTVVCGERTLRTETPPLLLDGCSAIESDTAASDPALLAQRLVRLTPMASVAIMVVGSRPDRQAVRRMCRLVPVGVRTVVVRCEYEAPLHVSTRALTSVATLGSLGDLPRVMRRLATA